MIRISLLHPDLLSKLLTPEDFAMRLPLAWRQRFVAKVNFAGNDTPIGQCWEWTAAMDSDGYGVFSPLSSSHPERKMFKVHRLSHHFAAHSIPTGLVIDHLCRNRKCLRPSHIQCVSAYTNVVRGETFIAYNRAKTHCPRGHELVPGNLTMSGIIANKRICLTCNRALSIINNRARRLRLKRGVSC